MAPIQPIRIGLIGAGQNTKSRHIPGFQGIPEVEIAAVANRTLASSQKVADEFKIPKACADWHEIIADPAIDAVCIGTWPYLHCEATLAALDAGKHVLCEARMAMNLDEARRMLAKSLAKPNLVAQLVPAPFTLALDQTICEIIQANALGDLISIDFSFRDSKYPDPDEPLTWRQDLSLSGLNTMTLGIFYETLLRWVGPAASVVAKQRIQVPFRKNAQGRPVKVEVPDHLEILADMACGATLHMVISQVCGHAPENICFIHGTRGTLKISLSAQELYLAAKGEKSLKRVDIPDSKKALWHVEGDFIASIREGKPVRLTSFEDGLRYMAFTEAVISSAQTGQERPIL